jgi:hypothetical protein
MRVRVPSTLICARLHRLDFDVCCPSAAHTLRARVDGDRGVDHLSKPLLWLIRRRQWPRTQTAREDAGASRIAVALWSTTTRRPSTRRVRRAVPGKLRLRLVSGPTVDSRSAGSKLCELATRLRRPSRTRRIGAACSRSAYTQNTSTGLDGSPAGRGSCRSARDIPSGPGLRTLHPTPLRSASRDQCPSTPRRDRRTTMRGSSS